MTFGKVIFDEGINPPFLLILKVEQVRFSFSHLDLLFISPTLLMDVDIARFDFSKDIYQFLRIFLRLFVYTILNVKLKHPFFSYFKQQ
jgi:hypothetical protein